MEPRGPEPLSLPLEQSLLLENLRSNQNDELEDLARRALAKPDVDIDLVYPHPLDKTLLDIACCEGRHDLVELLVRRGANVNRVNDAYNRSPIQFAVEAYSADVLQVLLRQPGIDPDLMVGQQTALHIAARKNSAECARLLLANGANPNLANSKGLTPIHIAGTSNNREMVELILGTAESTPNLDDFRDVRKRTTRQILEEKFPDLELPAVVESKIDSEEVARSRGYGNDESQFLESLGKNRDDRSANPDELLRIAAKRNFPAAVGELLKRRFSDGESPRLDEAARIAVELGHHQVLREILAVDSKIGNQVLLTACQELGVPYSASEDRADDRIKCLRLILDQPGIDVRCEDDKGNTPLHYAARAESIEAVNHLLRLGSYIGHRNVLGVSPLAHVSPGVLTEFFDDCLRVENERSDELEIEFDYRCLMPHTATICSSPPEEFSSSTAAAGSEETTNLSSEMETLAFVASNRALRPLLMHPLLSSFLYIKWHRMRHVFYANFVFYVVFYSLINLHILSGGNENNSHNSSAGSVSNSTFTTILTNLPGSHGLGSLAGIFLILLAIRESLRLASSPWRYLSSFENLLRIGLLILGAWTIVAPNPQVGAVVILLSAWELVALIGQHPRMSTGIEIFKTVSLNFARFLFLYAFLILAFALAFFTLFNDSESDENFPDPGHSLFKTIIMLTGEFDANDIPFVKNPILSHCIFVLFVFLIAIVLFNLLNGLAVSDTAEILAKSELVGLATRTKLISHAETVAVGSRSTICCMVGRSVRWSRLNPFGFLARRILLFPGYLPQAKLSVKPYKFNKIRVYGRTKRTRGCYDWSMDPWIVTRAREVLSRRGDVTENERIIGELAVMRNKLERMENILDHVRSALENNNVQNTSRG